MSAEPLREVETPFAEPGAAGRSVGPNPLLSFLAPGVLHQLGNVLFTIQGNALLIGESSREHDAITRAAARGVATVRMLQAVVGSAAVTNEIDVTDLLQQIKELVQVGLREAGRTLDLRLPPSVAPTLVDANSASLAVLLGLYHFVSALPAGMPGAVSLELVLPAAECPHVRLGFRPQQGQLPFPLAAAELLGALRSPRSGFPGTSVASLRDGHLEITVRRAARHRCSEP